MPLNKETKPNHFKLIFKHDIQEYVHDICELDHFFYLSYLVNEGVSVA